MRIILAVCIALSLSCATTTAGIKSVVADCQDSVTHSVATNAVNDVTSAIICDAGSLAALPACAVTALVSLAGQVGWPAIDCVLSDLLTRARAASGASQSEALIETRASAAIVWRSARP